MTRPLSRPAASALAFLLLFAVAVPAFAFTRLEGEYYFQVDARKQDRRYPWDFDSNSNDTYNNMQLRLFSQPVPGLEAFTKFEAEWNTGSNANRRPLFQYREAHLRYNRERNGQGVEAYLFSRQDRFWVDNHLIQVVQGGPANDGGNAQGTRLNLWTRNPILGVAGNTYLSLIAGDFSSQSNPSTGSLVDKPTPTDDAYIGRLRREFLGGDLRTGLTWNRKNTVKRSGVDQASVAEVWAGDLRYTLSNIDFSLEYAEGQQRTVGTPYRSGALDLSKFSIHHPEDGLPDDAVVKAEIRSLRVGDYRFGYLNVAPSFWYLGPQYRNQLGDGNNDETGYYINTWYLVPARAVTLTNNYLSYTKRVNQQRHVTEFYSEAYIEYVNGFTSKLFYRKRTTRDWQSDGRTTIKQVTDNDDVFAEMQVENKLAWMRLQFRIRDLSTVFQKELGSFETSVNISSVLKMYNRFTFGNDPARVRKGLFSELQYRPRPNLELFLAYGPFWIGAGSSPVYEGNLEGSADNKDLVRLTLKGTF